LQDSLQVSAPRERLRFIDGLRCIAVLWVVLYHFTHNSPFWECFTEALHPFFYDLAWNGYLGVEIFFVISGFVIALSLARGRLTPRFALGFAIRRYVRLFPPYIAVVFLWMLTTFLGNLLVPSYDLPQPSPGQLLSHFLYLQNLLGFGDIVAPTWTLCLEFQFYLFYAVCALLFLSGGRMRRCLGAMLFCSTTLASLSMTIFKVSLDGPFNSHNFFLGTWYLFVLGVLAAFAWVRPDIRRQMLFPVPFVFVLWMFVQDKALLVGIAAFSSILLAAVLGRMSSWLSNPVVQYIGSRSYSIYLVHWCVGLRFIDLIHRFVPQTHWNAWLCNLAGFTVTIVVSEILYRILEKPSLRLSQFLKPFFA
jgi:hypothetical protein